MSMHSALKVVGAFLWACIIGTLCAGAVVSALLFLGKINSMIEGMSR